MGRVNVYFTDAVEEALRDYLWREHGSHRALSLTIQKVVKEFLQKNDKKSNNTPEEVQ